MNIEYSQKHSYEITDSIETTSGAGALHKAKDLVLGRTVAIKAMKILGDKPYEREGNYKKALSEVKAMVQIGNLNLHVPKIYDVYYDQKAQYIYIVMDWIDGTTLTQKMDSANERDFIGWIGEICNILKEMSKKKLYHKDIKPDNIMITHRGDAFLIDFNISISTPNLDEGTIQYKAPEMDRGSRYVGREKVDMFSIGMILYEYYTGKPAMLGKDYAEGSLRGPFQWERFIEPINKNPNMKKEINDIIVKCMKLDPKDRYRDYCELSYTINNYRRIIR